MDTKKHYVYGLFRPDTGGIFYIGMGQGNRAWGHVRGRHKQRSFKNHILRKLIDEMGYSEIPVVIIRDGLTRHEAARTEIALINAIGRYPNGPLTNILNGGGDSIADLWWITNETENRLIPKDDPIPPGWRRGHKRIVDDAELARRAEEKQANREAWLERNRNRRWVTDGKMDLAITKDDPIPKGFRAGRMSTGPAHNKGQPMSDEQREKLRQAALRQFSDPEQRSSQGDKAMAFWNRYTPEERAQMMADRLSDPAVRMKMSESAKRRTDRRRPLLD